MVAKSWLVAGLFVAFFAACEERVSSSNVSERRIPKGGVVAKVNDEPIGLEEVRQLRDASGLAPEEALSRLIDERLLAQHAAALGFGDLPKTLREVERARARTVLVDALEGDESEGNQLRQERLQKLLKDLRNKTQVVYDEAKVREALADESLLGTGT